uniref:Uncharacterized protein n=1 Tax=Sphaeramia orbicularis TaxID=375764 RepID=A0A672YRH8_9TELE
CTSVILCKSVLVTGSSRGIGLQLVKELAERSDRPARIIATARDPDVKDAKKKKKQNKKNQNVIMVLEDVNSQESISSAVQEVQSIVGSEGLSCLINNAAINISTDLNTVTPDAMMTTFQVNSVSPLFAFLPLLQTSASQSTGMGLHRAAVINISSILGSIQANWGETAAFKAYAYRTSKAALNMLTRCLAVDLGPKGIVCMSLHPGWVKTDMGGPLAELTVEESVSGMLSVLSTLSEDDNGGFKDYRGHTLPW